MCNKTYFSLKSKPIGNYSIGLSKQSGNECWPLVFEINGEQAEESKNKAKVKADTMNQDVDERIDSISNEWPYDFKSMLNIAPLQGIDFDRPSDLGRGVDLLCHIRVP